MRQTFTLITGTGRSGTSTMAGTLHHLGLNVPGPYLGANESNPKGFFESRWSMRFHKRVLKRAGLHDFDGRPEAFDLAHDVISEEDRADVAGFLRRRALGHQHTVVKDPRSVWTQQLWVDAAADVGLDIGFIAMLRHPAEVVGSRSTYYVPNADPRRRRRYTVFNVSRWVNNSLGNERQTRAWRRAFVRYDDLLDDWRAVAAGLSDQLGLDYPDPPVQGAPHPVDDFIDPDLRRVRVTWDDLEIPASLQDIAEEVWQQLQIQATGRNAAAETRLDELAAAYAALFHDSAAISVDMQEQAMARGRREAWAEFAQATTEPEVTPTRLAEASGRELLQALRSRVRRRIVHR